MSAVDKEALFAPRLPEDDVEIPGVGTVRVRGLSRGEVFEINKLRRKDDDTGEDIERRTIAVGMVDPEMTLADVQRWQAASPAGELERVARRIQELSGMADDAAKATMLDFRDEPDGGV